MPLLLLIRHGENDFVKTGRLPGQRSGIHLNEKGHKQAQALRDAFLHVPIKAIYSSPLERAIETAAPLATSHKLPIQQESRLMDAHVGKWQGRSIKTLRLTNAWKVVQHSPSRFTFPEGESFMDVQTRIVNALEGIIKQHKNPKDVVAIIFHADPIKLAVSHFLGLPLDHFQRLSCDTGSVTALFVGEMGANLIKLNQRPPFDFLQQSEK